MPILSNTCPRWYSTALTLTYSSAATSRLDRPVETRRATASSDAVRFHSAGPCPGRVCAPQPQRSRSLSSWRIRLQKEATAHPNPWLNLYEVRLMHIARWPRHVTGGVVGSSWVPLKRKGKSPGLRRCSWFCSRDHEIVERIPCVPGIQVLTHVLILCRPAIKRPSHIVAGECYDAGSESREER